MAKFMAIPHYAYAMMKMPGPKMHNPSPYIVTDVTRLGSYRLATLEGEAISNSWNIEHLLKFYI